MEKLSIKQIRSGSFEAFWQCFKSLLLGKEFLHFPKSAREHFLKEKFAKRVLRGWLGRKDRIILGFWQEEEMVGILMAGIDHGGVSFLHWIGIKSAFQRKGLGSELMAQWEKIAKERGCHKLVAQSAKKENFGFYKKSGFRLEGRRKKDRYGLDFYVFGKKIGNFK